MIPADAVAFRAAGAPRPALIAIAFVTAAVLALNLPQQLFDTNFYSLWEATALLAGDHPYRDFFEWGIPLQAVLSAVAQRALGYRMLAEFVVVHWAFIIAGAVISFDLAYRVSRSLIAASVMAAVGVAVLADTATFHYPKLFVYPAAVWLAWRYLDRPSRRGAAALGFLTAVAFLFRHDHGVYIGAASVLAWLLGRWIDAGRPWRETLADAGTYAAVATLILLPWVITVQQTEGVADYVRARAELYRIWSAGSEYGKLLQRNPLRLLDDWNHQWPLPREFSRTLLAQVTAFVPFFVLASAGWDARRASRLGVPVPVSAYASAVGAVLLVIVDQSLFREPSYAHLVTPLTGALAARFFTSRRPGLPTNARAVARFGRALRLSIATAVLANTALAAYGFMRLDDLLARDNRESVARAFERLLASPPIDAFVTAGDVERWTNGRSREAWNAGNLPYTAEIMLRYMHDCVAPADRLLVSGSTPFQIGYLVERPIAGGHLFWHHRWRVDARREADLLALLQRQSVPFAFSTHDPVMNELQPYPRIRAHFAAYYQSLPGSNGRLLVDTRRSPTGHFGPYEFPCFK
jgi:hypothetical protein